MFVRTTLLVCLGAALAQAQSSSRKTPVDCVDPLIDTKKSRWIYFSSASRPFGMINLSPDTNVDGDWGAGYLYDEKFIRAFSHVHCWQLAALPVMPIVGRMNGHEGYEAYKSPFSHDKEIARAGYHKVFLENSGITVELTSTRRAGMHRYAFPGGIRDHAGYEHGPGAQGGGMKYYVERGYVPLGVGGKGFHREGAAQTMEYAYSDWCLAQFAQGLGKKDDAALFGKRSENWKKLWDAGSGWIRPRNMDGSWLTPFEPTCQGSNCRGFVESNSAIYTYFVPQDMTGLIGTIGGPEKFIEKLSRQFELAAPARFITPHGKHGENWIDYENQPACQMAHLFSHAGAPWLTQQWVRRIKEEVFGDTSPYGGYNGDEDQGQMGALGVLMAIGLFDVQGGAAVEPRYEITSPIFDRVTIALDRRYYPGSSFTIEVRNNKPANTFIQRAELNGRPLNDRFWITHKELTAGGKLVIELGPQPNKSWGVK